MAIVKYENVNVNDLTFGVNAMGEYTTTTTLKFVGRPLVQDVKNTVAITERYRVYSDLIGLKFNYTPNLKLIFDNQNQYSITWRGNDWRIADCIEANDRMSVTLMCYRNDPATEV